MYYIMEYNLSYLLCNRAAFCKLGFVKCRDSMMSPADCITITEIVSINIVINIKPLLDPTNHNSQGRLSLPTTAVKSLSLIVAVFIQAYICQKLESNPLLCYPRGPLILYRTKEITLKHSVLFAASDVQSCAYKKKHIA
jgi:hypothetical protein